MHVRPFRWCALLLVGLLVASSPEAALPQNTRENADFKLAINLYNDGLYDLAAEQLKQFINSFPATSQGIEARFYLGLTQLKLRQFEEARVTFQTFALTYQDNPRAPEAWWNVGEAYAALGNDREAALAYERVKVFHPRSKIAADALVRAAAAFRKAGERDNARRLLRIVLQEYPSSTAVTEARTQLGRVYFEEGNLDLARNELTRVIEGDPSPDARAQALLILGDIYQDLGNTDEAADKYREIIAKHGSSSAVQGAYVHLARLEAAAGNHKEAIANLTRSLGLTRNVDSTLTRDALIALGDAYAATRSFADAVAAYERFLGTAVGDARTPQVLWKEAQAHAKGKNYRKSDEVCLRLLRSAPPEDLRRGAMLRLVQNAKDQHRYPQAYELISQYLAMFPDAANAAQVMLEGAEITEQKLRDPRKSVSVYEILGARYPRSAVADEAQLGAGRCYEQLREFERALDVFGDALERFPASDHREEMETRVRSIRVFEAKNKDSGLEKLAMLVGDVVANKDRAAMAQRLGEIYFNDLKNYDAAATQFATALADGIPEPGRADALFLRARSLEYLSWKNASLVPQAVQAYEEFITAYPGDRRAGDAEFAVFSMNASTLKGARAGLAGALGRGALPARHAEMVLRVGVLAEEADSLDEAMRNFAAAMQEGDSTVAQEAIYRQSVILLGQGFPDSSYALASELLRRAPAGRWSAEALSSMADIDLRRGNHEQAMNSLQRLLDDFGYTSAAGSALRRLGDAQLGAGYHTAAIATYSDLLSVAMANPVVAEDPDPALLLGLGKAHYLAGNPREARRYFFQLLARENKGPRAAEAYMALGMMYRNEGTMDIATSYFRQAGLASPETAANKDVAALLFEAGQYDDAVRQYTQLVRSSSDPAEQRGFASRIIVALWRDDQGAQAAQQLAAFRKAYGDPTDEEAAAFTLEEGNAAFRKKDYTRAMSSFETVASKYDETPSAPVARYWIAKIYEATNRPADAVQQLDRLLKDYPQAEVTQKAYLTLGNISYRTEKWDEAIRNYRQIVDNPASDPALLPFAMSNLIGTYEIASINDAALALTRRYLELYPNAEDAFDKKIKMGILYQRLGYFDQSIVHLQGLLDEAGSDLEGEIRYYIGEGHYYKGDYQQAILEFLKVPYLVTKKGKVDWTATSLYMSGQAYEKMGKHEQALLMYRQILERSGIDETFKAAAKKEIDRVNLVLKKAPK